jgi:hypothetical protein
MSARSRISNTYKASDRGATVSAHLSHSESLLLRFRIAIQAAFAQQRFQLLPPWLIAARRARVFLLRQKLLSVFKVVTRAPCRKNRQYNRFAEILVHRFDFHC